MSRVLSLSRLARIARTRPRLWSSIAVGLAVYALMAPLWPSAAASRLLVAWNAGAWLYLGLAWHMARQASSERIRQRALHQDEGRLLVLTLVVLASVAVLVAIASQLAEVKDLHGIERSRHVALAVLTVVSAWLFTQTLFALHYAHDFYIARARRQPDVLGFPGTAEPTYGDFFYFACVIGTSGQTADVAFTSSALRPIGTLHCILAFVFNTSVLALTINIGASLF